jgi:hypothetical protein
MQRARARSSRTSECWAFGANPNRISSSDRGRPDRVSLDQCPCLVFPGRPCLVFPGRRCTAVNCNPNCNLGCDLGCALGVLVALLLVVSGIGAYAPPFLGVHPLAVGHPPGSGLGPAGEGQRPTGRTIWTRMAWSAGLARVDGGRDDRSTSATRRQPDRFAAIIPEPERPCRRQWLDSRPRRPLSRSSESMPLTWRLRRRRQRPTGLTGSGSHRHSCPGLGGWPPAIPPACWHGSTVVMLGF